MNYNLLTEAEKLLIQFNQGVPTTINKLTETIKRLND